VHPTRNDWQPRADAVSVQSQNQLDHLTGVIMVFDHQHRLDRPLHDPASLGTRAVGSSGRGDCRRSGMAHTLWHASHQRKAK
jgi:hypothetical protein